MPRERPTPPPFEPVELERSLDRYLMWGLAFMVLLIAGFIAYRVREPTLRKDASAAQEASYREIGTELFATNCSSCHGKDATGGSAPVLNAKEFLKGTTDDQIRALIAGGISGTDMPAWKPRVRRDPHGRASPADHDLPPFTRTKRPEHPGLAWRPRLIGRRRSTGASA